MENEQWAYFGLTHLGRMTPAVKEEESLDPIHIGLLSAFAVIPSANRLPHLIEEFRLMRGALLLRRGFGRYT